MIRYFAQHPTAANLLMIAIIIIGFNALPHLNKETFPEIKTNKIQVTIAYPGASPSEVEDGICTRLETATDGISFLKQQTCQSRDNTAVMTLEMQEAGNLPTFMDDINAAVDGIADFPDDIKEPVIKELGRTNPVASIAITADLSQPELKTLAEYYRNRLLALPAIPIAEVSSFSTHELSVLIKPETLQRYKLSIEDIANLIKRQSLDVPAGTMETHDGSYQIRIENARRNPYELADLVILNSAEGGRVLLGDIATIEDNFSEEDKRSLVNRKPAAIIDIKKNTTDDTLKTFYAVEKFVNEENQKLPDSTRLIIIQNSASAVEARLDMLSRNGLQGLFLAMLALLLFFSWRYTFWVTMSLPISFLGGLVCMVALGVSINMISMVALLMAIGILMDDGIVISESIEAEFRKGKPPLQASIDGLRRVIRGVMSSFVTSFILFGSLLSIQGEMGQVLVVLPMVLLSVLTISLIEAFLILPNHLKHSLEKNQHTKKPNWRFKFEDKFEALRQKVIILVGHAITFRYLVLGSTIALFILSFSLLTTGVVKFKGFPSVEGNQLQARLIMPQGTPFSRTEEVVNQLLNGLQKTLSQLPPEDNGELIKNIQISYSSNPDAKESGSHLASINVDLLSAEQRNASMVELKQRWRQNTGEVLDAIAITFKEPQIGPGGQAISIWLQGDDLNQLSSAAWELQTWLQGYEGVYNLANDLRPGTKQFSVTLQPGALLSGLDSTDLANQLRAAYQGIKVDDIYYQQEAYEINVMLNNPPETALETLSNLTVFSKQGADIPLSAIATLEEKRGYSQITRVNGRRTITVTGDVDTEIANSREILADTRKRFFSELEKKYPQISISLQGEAQNTEETSQSILFGFISGLIGIYLLLSLQFSNYREPFVVMLNIPLALIGVIWGHFLMGIDLSMPSMIGFVALAGVVVNDSILLVEFIKQNSEAGMSLHKAALKGVSERFRAVFLTSITTVAGMLPLLSETSTQAQVLVPLVTSIAFGMISATLLIIFVLPSVYSIFSDFGLTQLSKKQRTHA